MRKLKERHDRRRETGEKNSARGRFSHFLKEHSVILSDPELCVLVQTSVQILPSISDVGSRVRGRWPLMPLVSNEWAPCRSQLSKAINTCLQEFTPSGGSIMLFEDTIKI